MSAKGQLIQLKILRRKMDNVVKQIEKFEGREKKEYLKAPVEFIGSFLLRDNARFLSAAHMHEVKELVDKTMVHLTRAIKSMEEAKNEQRTGD